MSLNTLHSGEVNEKITLIQQHLDDLCLVFDFDGTLTQYFDEQGHSRPSIISLLRDEGVLDEDYSIQAKAMYTKYSIIEHNEELDESTRHDAMNEWRTTHKELLKSKGLTKQHIEEIVLLDRMVMRSGTDQFFTRAQKHNIPIIIFSASGIGTNMIHLLLERWGLMSDNISVASNELYRDESGKMSGYSIPVIHSLNKTESIFDDPKYADLKKIVLEKEYFIVVGDGLADAQMITQTADRTILTVGLCNDKVDERLSTYQDQFDIVITHDDGFDELLDQITHD